MILFLSIFILMLHIFFFFYDRSVIIPITQECAVFASQTARKETVATEDICSETEQLFMKRTAGKLVWLTSLNCSVTISGKTVKVEATASRPPIRFRTACTSCILYPEEKIRYESIIRDKTTKN